MRISNRCGESIRSEGIQYFWARDMFNHVQVNQRHIISQGRLVAAQLGHDWTRRAVKNIQYLSI